MKILFPVILFFLSQNTYAQVNACHDHHPELKELKALAEELQWNAATDEQIRNAPCTRKEPLTEKEMQDWLTKSNSKILDSKLINGISFENESVENLKIFDYLTSAVDLIGQKTPEKQQTFKSECKKVDCALKEIFGETSTQLLYLHKKYGFNGSHITKENNAAWGKKELDTILLALTDFPEGILPVEKNRSLVHAERGFGNGNTIANAVITVYDLWDAQTPEQQRYTITHELGHVIAKQTKLDDHKHWMDLSGWEKNTYVIEKHEDGRSTVTLKGDKKQSEESSDKVERSEVTYMEAKNDKNIVSMYGQTNNWEDLAEAVSGYRYNPEGLKKVAPEKYKMIKEVIFDNVEFTSEEACTNPKRLTNSVAEMAKKTFDNWKPTEQELQRVGHNCSELAIEVLAEKGKVNLNSEQFKACYKKALSKDLIQQAMKSVVSENKEFLGPMIRNLSIEELLGPKSDEMMTQIYEVHKKDLVAKLTKPFAEDFLFRSETQEESLKYSYQDFIGVFPYDTYYQRDQFEKVSIQMFRSLKANNPSAKKYSSGMIANEFSAVIK